MIDGEWPSRGFEHRLNLQRATGIARHQSLGSAGEDVRHFAIPQAVGHLGFGEVVASGGSATDVRLGEWDQLHSRNQLEQITRLLPNLLSVGQVAGVVVRRTTAPPEDGEAV